MSQQDLRMEISKATASQDNYGPVSFPPPTVEQTQQTRMSDVAEVHPHQAGHRRDSQDRISTSPLRSLTPLPEVRDQPVAVEEQIQKWQDILWREWCRCKDEEYAFQLYYLVKATALGWKMVVSVASLCALGGALIGYLLGSNLIADLTISIGPWDLTGWPPLILAWAMGVAGGMMGVSASRMYRSWYFWWRGQPSVTRVEKALKLVTTVRPEIQKIWAEPLRLLEEQRKRHYPPDQLITALQSPNWINRFVARQALIALGGEATEALQDLAADRSHPLWQVAIWLLTSIEQETTNQFVWRVPDIQCPRCLTRFDARSVDLSWGISFTYYGCRLCGQSREYFYVPQGVVAVLDSGWSEAWARRGGRLRANWLTWRDLFDFDWVEIVQATDEDVERFAVQVGNDTDPYRRSGYKQMRCLVSLSCRLSENTLRILQRMFGRVEWTNKLAGQKLTNASSQSRLSSKKIKRLSNRVRPQSGPNVRLAVANE